MQAALLVLLTLPGLAVSSPLADTAAEWQTPVKKAPAASARQVETYTLQGGDLIEDAPTITIGGPYTGTTTGYSDDYLPLGVIGQLRTSGAPDVVYRFLNATAGGFRFDLCESGFDTRIYLLAADGVTLEAFNDDACPGYRSRLDLPGLAAGEHYVVVDGAGVSAGDYSLTISRLPRCRPVDIPPGSIDELEGNDGCNSPGREFQTVACGDIICGDVWTGADQASRDTDWYRLELATATSLELLIEVDEFDPMLNLLAAPAAECEWETIGYADQAGYCEPERLTSCCLPAGVYYIVVGHNSFEPTLNGNYLLTIDGEECSTLRTGSSCDDPLLVIDLPFFDSGDTRLHSDTGFNPGPDLFYMFTTTRKQDLTISLCSGSDFDTVLRLLADDCRTPLAVNDDGCGLASELSVTCLPAGTYYAMIEGYDFWGGLYTIVINPGTACDFPRPGESCEHPWEIIELPFQDRRNSVDYDDDGFNIAPDVFYHLTISSRTGLTASLCHGTRFDTYLHLLAADGLTVIRSNDDACGLYSQLDFECLQPGDYYLVVEGFDGECGGYTLDVTLGESCEQSLVTEPMEFALYGNFPNPFNPTTTIEFSLAEETPVNLSVYSVTGELIVTLIDREMSAGKQSVLFDATDFTNGVYFYTLTAGNFSDTKKMIVVK